MFICRTHVKQHFKLDIFKNGGGGGVEGGNVTRSLGECRELYTHIYNIATMRVRVNDLGCTKVIQYYLFAFLPVYTSSLHVIKLINPFYFCICSIV